MNDEQLLRYSRHILLDEIGIEGQQRLLDSTVLVVGAGGLGSPAALYLAAAGVGRLLLADGDTVDLTNLQRQILHRQDRIGMAKTASAALTLNALNPEVQIVPLPRLDTDHESDDGDATADASAHAGTRHADGASASIDTRRTDTSPEDRVTTARNQPTPSVRTFDDAVQQADVVLDCSDNFATRHAINRACVAHRKPLVSGTAIRFDGQFAVFDLRQPDAPCYQCLFPDGESIEETRCSQMGVFAPLTGIIGTLQAAEALKLAGGFGTPMTGHLWLLDARTMRFTDIRVPRDPGCAVCGGKADIRTSR